MKIATSARLTMDPQESVGAWFWCSRVSVVMDNMDIVRLSVPGTLAHRDLVLRGVASVCRLVRRTADLTQELGHRERVEDFDEKVVSAVGEAFNNVAIHAYRNVRGAAEIELEFEGDSLTIRLLDRGDGFEIF